MSLQYQLIIAAVIALLAGGGGWQIRDWQVTERDLKALQDSVAKQAAIGKAQQTISATYQKKLTALQSSNRRLQEQADDDIQANPGYAACLISDGMLQLIQRATAAD